MMAEGCRNGVISPDILSIGGMVHISPDILQKIGLRRNGAVDILSISEYLAPKLPFFNQITFHAAITNHCRTLI